MTLHTYMSNWQYPHLKHKWQPWFAWRPVRLTYTGKRIWLERIYRRAQYKTYATYDDWQRWEYGTLLDVLASDTNPRHQGRLW